MDFRLTADQQLLRQSVREFAETEIRPHVREWDEAQHFPTEVVPRLGELGLLGIQVPDAYGGAGMSDDFPLAMAFVNARTLRLADGPDEVHRGMVARLELGKYA